MHISKLVSSTEVSIGEVRGCGRGVRAGGRMRVRCSNESGFRCARVVLREDDGGQPWVFRHGGNWYHALLSVIEKVTSC